MEIELKFLVSEEIAKERLIHDGHLRALCNEEDMETISMNAIYFDTEDKVLEGRRAAYRVRTENDRYVATMKWGSSTDDGLHLREELNVPVDEAFLKAPNIEIFKGSAIYDDLCGVIGDKRLMPVMEMEFQRRQIQVDTGKSISMLSYDQGEIRTPMGKEPISELEIELYSGDKEDMIALGRELAQKYNLKAENKSKYQRGLELIGLSWEE